MARERKSKTTEDAENLIKELFGDIINEMLKTEHEEEPGCSKHDYKNKETDNSRNGYTKRTVNSSYDKIELSIPRNRKGEFEPIVVKKHQRSITSIEDRILSMYARGITYRDIQVHLQVKEHGTPLWLLKGNGEKSISALKAGKITGNP